MLTLERRLEPIPQYYEVSMVGRILHMSAANVRRLARAGQMHYSALALRTETQGVYLFTDADIVEFQYYRERLKQMGKNHFGLASWFREPRQLELLD